ncbi:hypothetical protein FH041_14250 [Pseudomonas sp. SWI7]|uniref:hypothetical protein n=1 Tax=Pseudomonas sp. SWI7 TaxID=2587597 RepID=UPI00111E2E02|nr:hypothetical protein [Pseudomonas sp. SWI7]QDC06014.1 hypothetical protein FH041_14250 [Pseudomonas sp. SWI7]
MTLLKPTIIVEELLAKAGGKVAYQEKFHKGINVLSGCNGGGKTSVVQLLMFGLGYEIVKWKDEASQCDCIYVGVRLNGTPVTLRRINRLADKQSMDICYKGIDEALKSPVEEWFNYPYAISAARESFSQKIFSLLDIPEAKADSNGNSVTLHQVFRLIYSNQSNSSGSLFNAEPFDSAFKRESVGNYLLGLYDDELYNSKISLAVQEKNLDRLVAKLQAVYSVVGKTSFAKDFGTIDEARAHYVSEIAAANLKVLDAKQSASISYVKEKGVTEGGAVESVKIKGKLLECESDIQVLSYEIEDSREFLAELIDKSKSIQDSIKVDSVVGDVVFKFCPGCYRKIDKKADGCCCLCGAEGEAGQVNGQFNLLRMKNEIDIQIRESERILIKKEERLLSLVEDRKKLRTALRQNISKITSTISSVNSESESEIYNLYREMGEIEEKISTLDRVAELHRSISELTAQKNTAQAEVTRLRDLISLKKSQYYLREPEVKGLIATHLINILRQDVGAEKEFKNAETVEFDFASNTVSINGKVAFSESGTVYLNNAFHLALFITSLEKEYVRIPRFMVLDGIENGGMEDVRSRNFQKVMGDYLSKYTVDYQLIYATKSISPFLDSSAYVVGRTFTEDDKSLNL